MRARSEVGEVADMLVPIAGVLTELHPVLDDCGATLVVDGHELFKTTGKDLQNVVPVHA